MLTILASTTNDNLKKVLSYAVIIIAYFVIMYIKDIIIRKINKTGKKTDIANTIINIIILLGFMVLVLLIEGFKFNNKSLNYEELLNKNANSVIGTVICLIISTAILNTTKAILMRPTNLNSKRKQTLSKVTMSILRYTIYIIDVIIILAIWGINIIPVLTGLGIAGLVIGLGAQKLINDFISGVFIVFEHHYDIGDLVEVDGFTGEVIDIGLKTTRIKSWTGEVKIIANGKIDTLINYSVDNMTAVVEFMIAYKENASLVIDLLNKELPLRFKDYKDMVKLPSIVGVTALNDSGITIRAICTVKAGSQFDIERQLRKTIKEILDENNIEIPFPQIVVHKDN